jgi:Putative collagen-binding domain of a collagenase
MDTRPRLARLVCVLFIAHIASRAQVSGPLVTSNNPNYFRDANGAVLILNGSQTWNTFQDWGSNGSLQTLDFDAFVSFLTKHGHNFTLLWITEMPKFCGFPATESSPPDLTAGPLPWLRTGPGYATDGGLKFNLTKFNPGFFDRLRARTEALNRAGIYAGVYLFTGEWLNIFRCSSDGYPFTGANNINGVDDGYTGGKKGTGAITMTAPNAITTFQDAYVEKVIDTLNDLPNVLWIVSEEAPANSTWWNDHQIAHVRAYESKKPHQHPIGYAALIGGVDATLYNSDADWMAPAARISPAESCGSGRPRCKVNVNDSDHSYWEMWKDTPQVNRNYAWENFMHGSQVLFMDPYVAYYPREKRNLCVSPKNAVCSGPDKRYDNFRDNLGYILRYSRKLNLAKVTPSTSLSSTGFCLAQTPPVGAEYLVYAPSGGSFTVNLSAMSGSRTLSVEWFNPSTGAATTGDPVPAGSSSQSFSPPFGGDAVLYLVDTAGDAATSVR